MVNQIFISSTLTLNPIRYEATTPDFLLQKDDGAYVIVEVKGDNMIDDPVVFRSRKKEFC